MISGSWLKATRMPRRVVVEFTAEEFKALEARCNGQTTPAQLIRLVALRLAGAVTRTAVRVRR
jgi:hypothetical protein